MFIEFFRYIERDKEIVNEIENEIEKEKEIEKERQRQNKIMKDRENR